ncbi:MAG: hypothetical protein WB392_09080, partial [Methanotrichaceae archaeon]
MRARNIERKVGAHCLGKDRCAFSVWAPFCTSVALKLISPQEGIVPLIKGDWDYWHITAEGIFPGQKYFFRLNVSEDIPDPASRSQPEGVNGPSQVIDPNFPWQDSDWKGLHLDDTIIYEIHVGTFTPQGTFDAITPRLGELLDLGINSLEIMPVAQFPGERNWGYDGVFPFAVQNS